MTDGAIPPPAAPAPSTGQAASGQSAAQQATPAQQPTSQQPSSQQAAVQQPATQQPATQQPATSPATAQQALPPELARAPAGTVIEAEAAIRNSDGSVTVRTPQGDIRADVARSQVAELLQSGTRVTLELRHPTASPPQLVITVRGGAAPAPAGGAAGQPSVSTSASGPPPTVPLTVGRVLQAVAVPGPSPVQATPPAQVPTQSQVPVQAQTPAQGAQQVPGPSPSAQSSGTGAGPAPSSGSGAPGATPPTPAAPAPSAGPSPGPAQSAFNPQAAQSAYRAAQGLGGRAVPTPTVAAGGQATPAPATPGNPASAPQGPATAGGGLAAASGSDTATAGGRLPTGAIVTVRVLATGEEAARFVGARPTGTQPPPAAGGATVLTGTVAGVSQSGRPVVATPFGHLALNATSDLRIGDRVALDVLASRVGDMPTAERAAPLSVLAREWPALEGAMRALHETIGPQAAVQVTQAMARPSPQMSAAVLFFMNALKGGDMRSWFGQEAARTLESAGRGGLLSALAEDFQTLQRAAEPMDTGWRAFLIPVVGEERRPIRLLTRKRKRGDKEGDGKGGDSTSFLVDLELSKLGPFRLDGLVRDDLVDLRIRTTKPLPAIIRHDIKALFEDTLDRTGIQGRLDFKATPVLPPLPVPDLEVGDAGDTESLFA